MQDHEKHEQYQADKPKFGTTTSDVEKGGPGSGPQGKETHTDALKMKAKELRSSYNSWRAQAAKDPSDERAHKMVELFEQKIKDFVKENAHSAKVAKSLMGSENYSAIDTADYSISEEAAKDWLDKFREVMTDYNYGDAPRKIELSRGYSMIMSKVDDGQYSGFVTQSVDRDGSPLEENVAKVDKQTLADAIQYLKAREYIMPESHEEAVERVEEDLEEEKSMAPEDGMEAPEMSMSETQPVESEYDKRLKLLGLIDRLLNGI